MSDTLPFDLSKYSYRELAYFLEQFDDIVRYKLGSHVSDGVPPKEVLHTPYMSRQESEVPQDNVRAFLEFQQACGDAIRRQMEKYRWVEAATTPRSPFTFGDDQENRENGKPKEEPRRKRRRAKDPTKPPSDGGGGPS